MGNARRRKKTASRLCERRPRRISLEGLEPRRLLSSTAIGLATQYSATPSSAGSDSTTGIQGYSPAQVANAYGFSAAVSTAGANGSGQTIAIVEAYHSNTIVSDLQTFDQQFNLPAPTSLQQYNQSGRTNHLPAVNNIWSGETALDVEWAHAVAPGANIVIVEANSDRLVDLLAAVDTARRIASVSVVSISWGVNEFADETSFDYMFAAPAGHQNITFVASSGEHTSTTPLQWPAVSPNVVSVGGSTLTLANSAGITSFEAPWTATDSGNSQFEPAPGYQKSSTRGVPDVVYDANPSTGFAVYDSTNGGWVTLGGTSAGAPQWAALIAISDQIRSNSGQSTLDGGTQTLPQLYTYYNQASNATIDLTSGSTVTIAGALVNSSGAAQGAQVIASLASSSASAVAPSAPVQKAHPVKVPVGLRARPFFQFTPVLTPTSVLSAAGFGRPAPAHDELRQIATASLPLTGGVTSDGLSLAVAGATASSPVSTSMLNGAFSATAVAAPQVGTIAEAFAGLFVTSPGVFGETEVVRVGAEPSGPLSSPGTYFYIARLDTTAFCDAVSSFINECAAGSQPLAMADEPSHGHARAWTITGAVAAIDALILHHLVIRRRGKIKSREGSQAGAVQVPLA